MRLVDGLLIEARVAPKDLKLKYNTQGLIHLFLEMAQILPKHCSEMS